MATQPPDEQTREARRHRSKAWRVLFFALGSAIAACAYLLAFGGLSAIYSNLGCLVETRALLKAESGERDVLLNRAGHYFQEALRSNPENSRAYHNLGLIYLAWGQKPAAQEAFEQVLRLVPHSRFSNYQLGILYDEQGQEEKAIAAWREARAAPWLVREGRRCQSSGDTDCAERLYGLAITVQPDDSYAHYRLGVLYAGLGRQSEAIESYNRALALGSEHSSWHHLVQARALALEERWEEAIMAYQQAISLNPHDAEPYEQIAAILLRQHHDTEGAIEWYLEAVEADEERVRPYLRLAEIYQDLQDYPQSQFWYRQALGVIEDSPQATAQIQAGLSRCALAQGDLQAAARAAESAVNAQPGVAAYHVLLADAYAEMKRYRLAITSYQAALDLDPRNKRAQQQLQALGWEGP